MALLRRGGVCLIGELGAQGLVPLSYYDSLSQVMRSIVGNLDAGLGWLRGVLCKLNEVVGLDAASLRFLSRLLSGCRLCFSSKVSPFALQLGSGRDCRPAVSGIVSTTPMFLRGSEQPCSNCISVGLVAFVAGACIYGFHFPNVGR